MRKYKVSFDEFCWKVIVYTIAVYVLSSMLGEPMSILDRCIIAAVVGMSLAALTSAAWNVIVDVVSHWK